MHTRVFLHGNIELAKRYHFIASRLLLDITLREMGFQNLLIYRRRFKLEYGIEVVIRVQHSMRVIHITAPHMPVAGKKPIKPEELYVLVFLGDEQVGYHFFLWGVMENAMYGQIETAETLEEIETRYQYLRQEIAIIQQMTVGTAEQDFSGFDLTCTAPCTVYQQNVYTHPVEGSEWDDRLTYQAGTYEGTSGEIFEYELWQWIIDFYDTYFPYFCASNLFEMRTPDQLGQMGYLKVRLNRYYQIDVDEEGIPAYFAASSISYDSPLGLVECIHGDPHPESQATDDDYSYVWGRGPDNSVECIAGNTLVPFTFDKRADGGPDWQNSDFRVKRTFDNGYYLDVPSMFQIYTVSFWEFQGDYDWVDCDVDETFRQHLIFVAAACGLGLGDPTIQERNPDFETAIKDLILQAHTDQLAAGSITDEDSYRGYIKGYYTQIFYDPAKDDPLHLKKKEMLGYVNAARAENGADPLRLNPDLANAAIRHAQDLAETQSSGHIGSDGSTAEDRILDSGYAVNGRQTGNVLYGENAAQNEGGSTHDVYVAWKNSSEGHWETMIDPAYQETGFGIFYDVDGMEYWVETFGYNPNNQ